MYSNSTKNNNDKNTFKARIEPVLFLFNIKDLFKVQST